MQERLPISLNSNSKIHESQGMKRKWSNERTAGELPLTCFSCKHCAGPLNLVWQ